MSAAALWLAVCAAQPGAPPDLRPLEAAALETPVLALAFASRDELVALSPEAVVHYRVRGARLEPLARRPVPLSGAAVRHASGLLLSEPGARSIWALASGWEKALLLDLDDRLEIRSEAEALPWPGTPRGVRFRPGTSLIEAELPGLGAPPFLALAPGAALDATARLWRRGAPSPAGPVGTPLASFPGGGLLTGSDAPPGEPDALLFMAPGAGSTRLLRGQLPGSLRALATTAADSGAVRCVLALEAAGATRLFSVSLGSPP